MPLDTLNEALWRRLRRWQEEGVRTRIWQAFLASMDE